jgi:hypothetical protein
LGGVQVLGSEAMIYDRDIALFRDLAAISPDILTLYPVSKIEALERAARIDGLIAKQLSQSMSINAKLQARIEALEAALRKCVQYHVEAAADCRAISAVNQDNCLGPDSLTAAIDHDIAAEDIGEIVRAALDKEC